MGAVDPSSEADPGRTGDSFRLATYRGPEGELPSSYGGARVRGRVFVWWGVLAIISGIVVIVIGYAADLANGSFNQSCAATGCSPAPSIGWAFYLVGGVILVVALVMLLVGAGRVREERGTEWT